MTRTALLTLLVGVALTRAVASDQSELTDADEQPIAELGDHVGQSRVEGPQVVLQLKYDKGELNKIYLAQFRKGQSIWEPSVPARNSLCADLCHAGLGGSSCGSACADMLPVGLQAALQSPHATETTYGEPRNAVCPTLCSNQLGEPLCNCSARNPDVGQLSGQHEEESPSSARHVDWSGICHAFCLTDGYTLGGCPTCEKSTTVAQGHAATRILNTLDGWTAWCNVQCIQGHGGAACNCDRSPLQ